MQARPEHLAALRAFRDNDSLYAMEVPERRHVIFRVDGTIVEISPVLHRLLAGGGDDEGAITELETEYGAEAVGDALDAAVELYRFRLFTTEPPPLRNPAAETAQPGGILIMITQTCNLACTYCYAGGGSYGGKTKLMSEAGALRAIDLMLERAPQRKTFTVTFFGGEPLLNFRMVQRVVRHCDELAAAQGVRFKFSMTTNGTIVTDEIIRFLREHDFDLMVSFDGEAGADNRPFVDGRSSHRAVTENLRRLAAANVRFQMRATITREMVTREAIGGLARFADELGREVLISPASETKNVRLPDTSELSLRDEDANRLSEIYQEASADAAGRRAAAFDPNRRLVQALVAGKARGMGKCGACLSMAAASTDGKIYPCHRFVGMEEYAIGSLEHGVDSAAVNSFFSRAEAANKAKCDVCFARQICGGFCFYTMADGEGDFAPPDERDCDRFRKNLKFAIATVLRTRDGSGTSAGHGGN